MRKVDEATEKFGNSEMMFNALNLTDMQKKFVKHFVETGQRDALQSMREAGYTSKNKNSETVAKSILMRKAHVKEAISRYRDMFLNDKKLMIETDIYTTLHSRVTLDPRRLIDVITGSSVEEVREQVKNLPFDIAMCIDEIKFKYWGKDSDKFTVELKYADKTQASSQLMKLTGIMAETTKKSSRDVPVLPAINIQVVQ